MTQTLIFGGRRWFDQRIMRKVMNRYHAIHRPEAIHVAPMQRRGRPGELYGADFHVALWAEERKIPVHVHWAPWHLFGGYASNVRLKKMFNEGRITRALVFPGGAGALNIAYHLDHHMIPCDTYDMIIPLHELDDIERERIREEAERKARPRLPSAMEQVVEYVGSHAMERGAVLYVAPNSGKRPILTESDKFIMWHLHHAKCPFCKSWHWPGVKHRRMSAEESTRFDTEINKRYEIELREIENLRAKDAASQEPPPPDPLSAPLWDEFKTSISGSRALT